MLVYKPKQHLKQYTGLKYNIQQPVNAGSCRIDVKTARPGVDYRPH